jgi:RNA polymerase sigma factor (sigma-70 family)
MIQPITRERQINVSPAAKIFREHGDFIYQVICSKVNDKIQADDIFQDFFLSLVHRPIPQDIENIRGYLYTAVTNDIIDAVRIKKNYTVNMHRYYANQNCFIYERTPEKALIEVEEINKIFKLIKVRLTSTQYQAIVLRYRTNLTIKEIAEQMDVKDTSVSKYIYRGLSIILQFLKQKLTDDDNCFKS